MSQDKPELCGAWAENGFCTMPKGHNMGRLDIPSNHKCEKPVAAQEPITWLVEHTYRGSTVTFTTHHPQDIPQYLYRPEQYKVTPCYDHAAPCADPIAWRNIASPNGIRRFMTQKQYDANPNLQKYYEPFTCARCADAEQLHYKEMAERTVQEEFLLAAHADLEAKITEQAEELRIIRANEAQLEKDFDRRNEVIDAQAARISQLEATIIQCGVEAIEKELELEQIRERNTLQLNSQAERIKALEAEVYTITNRWKHRFIFEDEMQAKLAKADAVIEVVKVALQETASYPATGQILCLAAEALAAIEQYQTGEES